MRVLINEEEELDALSDSRSVDMFGHSSNWLRNVVRRNTQVAPDGKFKLTLFFTIVVTKSFLEKKKINIICKLTKVSCVYVYIELFYDSPQHNNAKKRKLKKNICNYIIEDLCLFSIIIAD